MPPPTPSPTRSGPPRPIGAAAKPAEPDHVFDFEPLKPKPLVHKVLYYGVEGYGKTTEAVQWPNPVVIMGRGEKGYAKLLDAGKVPALPAWTCESWAQVLAAVRAVETGQHDRKTLVIDAAGSLEMMCKEHVCNREFRGDWGEHGFKSFGAGDDATAREWLALVSALERVEARGMHIVMLGHARIKQWKNPMGPNFDRYECDVGSKVWDVTKRFFDNIFFCTYLSVVDTSARDSRKNTADAKGKGVGGSLRVMYCNKHDAYDAKNKYDMPDQIDIPNDPAEAHAIVWAHLNREIQQ